MSSGGVLLVIVGAWAVTQVVYGDALDRLGFLSRLFGGAPATPEQQAAAAAGVPGSTVVQDQQAAGAGNVLPGGTSRYPNVIGGGT